MLIPVTLAPIIFRKLNDVPTDAAASAAPVTAGLTLAVIAVISMRGSGVWRLWAAALGIVAGSVAGGLFYGIYDTRRVLEADWIGWPQLAWPGLDLGFSVPSSGPCCPPSYW